MHRRLGAPLTSEIVVTSARPLRDGKHACILSSDEAALLVPDNAVVTVSSSSGLGCPDLVLAAIGRRFAAVGHPRDITSVHPIAAGDMYGIRGIDHLAQPGLLRKVIAGSYPSGPSAMEPPLIRQMIDAGQIQAWNLPSGVMFQMHRAAATRQPAVLTKVGLDTFVDPRREGGAMNAVTDRTLVTVEQLQGQEWLSYPPLAPDVAIVRATTADEHGNLSSEHEGSPLGALDQALAAHNNGGIVIAQVKRIVKSGTIRPQHVRIPGAIVDVVVVAPDQMQTTEIAYDPALSGEIVVPDGAIGPLPWGLEKVLARRAAAELRQGWIVNLGFGVCSGVPRVLLEEGCGDDVTWAIEQGAVGGFPLTGSAFGCAQNPDAILQSADQFSLLQGGGLDAACLSFMEVDRFGNVNVSLLPGRSHVSAGIGGFADISSATRRLIFVGHFNAGRKDIRAENGSLSIVKDGTIPKFVPNVAQVSFSGRRAIASGQHVTFITERCVLELREAGLTVVEIAPGVDLNRDVLECAAIPLAVAPDLRVSDAKVFAEPTFGLKLDRSRTAEIGGS
jgi:propionate CoA-transferase